MCHLFLIITLSMKNDLRLAAKTLLKELGCLVVLICMKNKVSPFFPEINDTDKVSQYFKI